MMDVLSIIVVCLIAAILSVLIKQYKPEYGIFITISAGAGILLLIISSALPIFHELETLISSMGVSAEYFTVLLKALGVCYIAQLACDTCKDAGETTLAGKIELAAKVSILVMALPLFREIINIVIRLIG